jgi:L-ribulose-5-phosphate 3-epimerase
MAVETKQRKYGLNQAGFPTDDFAETCEIVSAAGYDGVEPNYTMNGPITTEDGRHEMKRAAESNGLSIPAVSTLHHWEYPLSSLDEEVRQEGLSISKGMVDAAAAFDADEVLIVPAVIEPSAPYERCYDRALTSVRRLARYGADRGVGIAVENVQNDFLYSPGEFRRFVDAASDAGPVSVYFDVGNGFRWGLPDRWIRELGERISKVHVKDWLTDAHRPTYPLQGDIDWQSVGDALAGIDYDGWITAEVPPYNSFPERMPAQVLETIEFLFDSQPDGVSDQ